MRRALLICLLIFLVLGATLIAAGAYLLHDEAFLKTRLHTLLLRKTGREFAIDGPLRLDLGARSTVEARGVRLQNAAWANGDDMLAIGRLQLTVDLRSLFSGAPVISALLLEDCQLLFASSADGASNWRLWPRAEGTAKAQAERSPLAMLREGQVRNCRLRFESPQREQPLDVSVSALVLQLQDDERWLASGAGLVNEEALSFSGQLTPVSALLRGGPLQYEVAVEAGLARLHSAGSFQDVHSGQGADLSTRFQGPEIAQVLAYLGQPALSAGAFDFRLELDTQGAMTRLAIDGDLGSLQAQTEGELDRLFRPTRGRVTGAVNGPDLDAFGRALGVTGLAARPYELKADAFFEPGFLRLRTLSLDSGGDDLAVSGTLGTDAERANSDLEFSLSMQQASQLAAALGQPLQADGAIVLEGRLATDAAGQASLQAQAQYLQSTLEVEGALGPLSGPPQPDLRVDFRSADPSPLGAPLAPLLGALALPRAPVAVRGRLAKPGALLLLDAVELQLDDHRATVSGQLAPAKPFTGSALRIGVDSPSAQRLGRLFDIEGWPETAFKLTGNVSHPAQRIRFEDVALDLAGHRAHIEGELGPRNGLAGSTLLLRLDSPDVAELAALFGRPGLPPEPFTLQARLAGVPSAFDLTGIEAQLGRSRAGGDLAFAWGAPRRITGKLRAPRLDLGHWTGEGRQPEPAGAKTSPPAFVFDQTPVTRIIDHGLELDLDLAVAELDLGHSQLRDITLGARLSGKRLELAPFSLRGAGGGLLSGRATLDDSGEQPRLDLELRGRDIRLGLVAGEGQDRATLPSAELQLQLAGRGATQREMAASLNGKLRFYQGPGLVAAAGVQFLFSDFVTELLTTLNPLAEKSPYTQLDCSVVAADIVDGQMTVSPLVFNTRELTIFSQGTIDLRTEKLDMSFNTKPRQGIGLSAGVVINPFIKVGGRLAKPAIELDPAGAAVSSGAAVATAGLSLLARSFADRFLSSRNPCGDARQEIEKRDQSSSR